MTGVKASRPFTARVPRAMVAGLIFLLLAPWTAAQDKPASFEELSSAASAAREANDIPRAIGLYGQALELNSKWADGWWFLGSLHYATDEYTAARDSLTHFIELTPTPGRRMRYAAFREFEIGEYDQSLTTFSTGCP